MKKLNKNYKKTLNEIGQQSALHHIICTFQDLGNEKNFELFQSMLDSCDCNDWDEASLVTILMVSHWYGENLNREPIYNKVFKYFLDNGYSEEKAERTLKGLRGNWKPIFGFEKELIGIK